MIFLGFETVTLVGIFLVLSSKGFKGCLSWLFPLNGAIYVVPFNKVDDQKVSMPAKKTKKDKKGDATEELIDFQLGAVVANYKNFENHDGMTDYDFITILLTTSTLALLCKIASIAIKDYFPNRGLLKGLFDDQNIDAYLLVFILFCYVVALWKNLFGLASMKVHKQHCFYMAFAALVICMFSSLGYNKFYIGRPKEAIQSFSVGVTALLSPITGTEKANGGYSDLLTLNSFSWIVTFTTCILVFVSAPSIIKFVDAFQIYRKTINEYEQSSQNISQDAETIETNKRLLKQYQIGSYLQILVLITQSIAIALHIRVVHEFFFSNNAVLGEISVAGFMLVALLTEAYTTHKELKDRSHYITEILVRYRPTTKMHKELFVGRCHQIYKESVKHMLHAMSRSMLPLVLLLLVIVFLRKQLTTGYGSPHGLQTLVVPELQAVLTQYYVCPTERPKTVVSIIRNYGVCVGVEAIDIHSKTPFTLSGGINIGQYVTQALKSYFRLALLNYTICKYLFTIGYIFIVLTTNEEIE